MMLIIAIACNFFCSLQLRASGIAVIAKMPPPLKKKLICMCGWQKQDRWPIDSDLSTPLPWCEYLQHKIQENTDKDDVWNEEILWPVSASPEEGPRMKSPPSVIPGSTLKRRWSAYARFLVEMEIETSLLRHFFYWGSASATGLTECLCSIVTGSTT
jgi:hypothetical protein